MSKIETLYQDFLESNGVSIDSRSLRPGEIFFAIRGERFDAGVFVQNALEIGAAKIVTQNTEWINHPNVFVVENVVETLQQLALHHRRQLEIPLVAITGTNGKTTTKELISSVLSKNFNVAFTYGNLNNEIGVPLTVLSINSSHEIAIIEMGASKEGDIDFLCRIAEPDYGLITNIGKAHLAGFGSYENIIRTKTELYRFIGSIGGKLFVNADDELLLSHSADFSAVYYGSSQCNVLSSYTTEDGFLSVDFVNSPEKYSLTTQLVGKYNLPNVLAALEVGHYFGVSVSDSYAALQNYSPGNSRSQRLRTKNNTLIVDAYNANPSSMALAIENFACMGSGNKLLILGSMLELGEYSRDEHKKILTLIEQLKFEHVILIGDDFFEFKSLHSKFAFFKSTDDVVHYLQEKNFKGHLILLKGSRGIAVEKDDFGIMKKEFRILGLMSGTSLDGLDMALCRFYFENSWKFEVEKAEISFYSDEEKTKIRQLPDVSANELVAANVWFAELMAKRVNSFLHGISIQPDFIASHGQTIFHRPDLFYTFQLGSGAVLSVKTQLPVVCDFRSQDVALHGQGAPLVPKGDLDLFSGFDAFLNIGGFANASILKKTNYTAFDICPANMLLNSLSALEGNAYDDKGRRASEGSVLQKFADDLANIPLFYQNSNSISLGREYFDQWYLPLINRYQTNDVPDLLITATEYIATQIQRSLKNVRGRILVSGGGTHNETLINAIRRDTTNEYFVEEKVLTDFKEAIVFAYLGLLRWIGQPNTLVEATGADCVVSGGCIYLP